jgi:hypothetical protein
MGVQRVAESKLTNLSDPSLSELAAQASRLVSHKIQVLSEMTNY